MNTESLIEKLELMAAYHVFASDKVALLEAAHLLRQHEAEHSGEVNKMVSLKKCLEAAHSATIADRGVHVVKAVLDAAGVKYHAN